MQYMLFNMHEQKFSFGYTWPVKEMITWELPTLYLTFGLVPHSVEDIDQARITWENFSSLQTEASIWIPSIQENFYWFYDCIKSSQMHTLNTLISPSGSACGLESA